MNRLDTNTPPVCAIILPCYNEQAVLPFTMPLIDQLLQDMIGDGTISPDSFALYVDDGSADDTWTLVFRAARDNRRVRGIKFSGNAGHQNALVAGMLAVAPLADCAVTIDADLQDDIGVIPEMLRLAAEGNHIVYGVRADRQSDSWFKRTTAKLFYAAMRALGAPIVPGHADFRLVSRFAMRTLEQYSERCLFLRSLFPGMKLPSAVVSYARRPRTAGETKYPLRKMLSFALSGLTASSPVPLRISAVLSLLSFAGAIGLSVHALASYFSGCIVPGWTSLTLTMLWLGAMQLFCMAVLGEYIARIFTEVRRRPLYSIEQKLL
ncbi:MAG: glycosyltransferase family 2 protein [Desulfovibrio sp.]|jgi:glycosyltransferase involved in cell wall biosynthesis|nr:glycosyltransferase family 2 protein [Desulfovibrio sp.]